MMEKARQLAESLLRSEPALAHQTLTEMLRLAHSQVRGWLEFGDCKTSQVTSYSRMPMTSPILQDPRENEAAGRIVEAVNTLEELAAIMLGDCGESSDLALLLMTKLACRPVRTRPAD